MNWIQRFTGSIFVLTFFGCATTTPEAVRSPDSFNESVAVLESGMAENAVLQKSQSMAVTEELLRALTPPTSTPKVTSEYFDLSVNKVGSHEFFRSLVVGTRFNMVVHPEVNGNISLDLKSVNIDDVMEIMREVYGYDYSKQGNLFQVFPDAIRTEIFPVDYLNVNRVCISE
jgi:MSHA biogenesis protein MshL